MSRIWPNLNNNRVTHHVGIDRFIEDSKIFISNDSVLILKSPSTSIDDLALKFSRTFHFIALGDREFPGIKHIFRHLRRLFGKWINVSSCCFVDCNIYRLIVSSFLCSSSNPVFCIKFICPVFVPIIKLFGPGIIYSILNCFLLFMSQLNDTSIITFSWAKRSWIGSWIGILEICEILFGVSERFNFNCFIISVDRESCNSSPLSEVSIVVVTQYSNVFSNIKSWHLWISLPIKVIFINHSWGISRLFNNIDSCISLPITSVVLVHCDGCWCLSSESWNLNLESQMAKKIIVSPPSLSVSCVSCISNERWKRILSLFNVLFLDESLLIFFSSDCSIVENQLDGLDIRGWSNEILWEVRAIVWNIDCFSPSKILFIRDNISSITVSNNNWLWNWIWGDNWDCVILLINWNVTSRINASINNWITD